MNPLWLLLLVGVFVLSSGKALGYVNGQPVEIETAPIGGGFKLRRDAAAAWISLATKAAREGVILRVERAFATMDQQTSLWQKFKDGFGNLAAKPGYSNHQGGVALDVSVGQSFTSKEYRWLDANASAFGWWNAGKYFSQQEPHHWEFRA